ncbi:MAG: 4Fe-4S binding protein [Eubacterium sp.]|nr:4Fe-4S binding protein [Eubacterium sp.]
MKLSKRRYTQLISAVLYNCNLKGYMTGGIYKGGLKGICAPSLNCYSCPGAVASCPLGSLQTGLLSSKYKIPYYVLGTILLFGILLGRFICGFLCPFGLLQELIYKLPVPKIKKSKATRVLSYLKYIILILFVILIPLVKLAPGFCKYICPAGTIEAGIPLTASDSSLRGMVGILFSWKVFVLAAVLLVCMFCYRSFCRFICPLGALYSFFAPVSVVGIKVDNEKCINCNACVEGCLMDINKVGDHECIHCGSCIKGCPTEAIYYRKNKENK